MISPERSGPPAPAHWARLWLRLCRPEFRMQHGPDVERDYAVLLAESRRRGWWAVWRLRWAFAVDMVRIARAQRQHAVRAGLTRRRGMRMTDVVQAVRQSVRSLVRQRAFTVVAVGTIALGLGSNAAVFSVIDAALLDGLPYPDHERLVLIDGAQRSDPATDYPLSYLDVEALIERSRQIEGLSPRTWERSFNLVGVEASENITGELATSRYFETLGVGAVRGRTFSAEVDVPGEHALAVIGYGLWQRWFGGVEDVVGRRIDLDGRVYEVIGVMPAGFRGLTDAAEVWIPLQNAPALYGPFYLNARMFRWLSAVARLAPGATVDGVAAELRAIGEALRAEYPQENADLTFQVRSLQETYFGDLRARLILLWAAAGFVLVIACANVANLFLVRGIARAPESRLRAALGASRGRIALGFVLEGFLVVGAGGALGVAVASVVTRSLVRMSGAGLPSFVDVTFDAGVLAVMLGIVFVAALFATIAPAVLASRVARPERLAVGDRGATAGRRSGRLQGGLVVAQIALALVLFIGSVLTLRGFAALNAQPLGFDAGNLLTLRMDLKAERFTANAPYWSFADAVLTEAGAVAGVSSAALAGPRIPTDDWNGVHIWVEERMQQNLDMEGTLVESHNVTPAYFDLLGIPLAAGRAFGMQDRDLQSSQPVVIVNRALAERYWPGESALGRRIKVSPNPQSPFFEVIGVVDEVRDEGLAGIARPTDLDVYFSLYQLPPRLPPQLNLLVRTGTDPASVTRALRERLHRVAPDVPFFDVRTMEERLEAQTLGQRFLVVLMGLFAALSVVLAAVGIYGLMAYRVARQRRELGVRLALGARPNDLLTLVVRRAALLAAAGVVLGAIGAAVLGQFLESWLHGVSRTDPVAFAGAAAALLIVALVASLLPALRAARVDPLRSIASE